MKGIAKASPHITDNVVRGSSLYNVGRPMNICVGQAVNPNPNPSKADSEPLLSVFVLNIIF